MLQKVENKFSHMKAGETEYLSGGLRDFFLYRDLGIAEATGGKVIAQLVKANLPPTEGTGWHFHKADFHIVIMLRGWARFMYEDTRRLRHRGGRGPLRSAAGHAVEVGAARARSTRATKALGLRL